MNNFDTLWRSVQEVDHELRELLATAEPTFTDIDDLIARYRVACQEALLADFEAAETKNIEGRLWDAHLKINSRYRKLLAKFSGNNGKQRPVEKRKQDKRYLSFVKSSTRFYREYVYHLSSAFGPVPELFNIAKSLHLEGKYIDEESLRWPLTFIGLRLISSEQPPEDLHRLILRSCHFTLVRLGDLSRYRETELKSRERNWGPAIGYYDLATALHPQSGDSHNRLAAIALVDNNRIRTVYHLHRALTVEEPFPTAKANLELEFKKILEAWKKQELPGFEDSGEPGKALCAWFVCLHAHCYKGIELEDHDELENEFLRHLAVELKERSLDHLLQKICLVNIAAEYLAGGRVKENPTVGEHLRAYVLLLRLNVKTFFTLLQILLSELEPYALEGVPGESTNVSERLTATTRRILPALRQYSSWLLTSSRLVIAMQDDDFIRVHLNEFWKIYANALTLLTATFPVLDLPTVDYLLDEDEDTIAFKPLCNEHTNFRYFEPDAKRMKSRSGGSIERNHPNVEMLSRIRGFVADAVQFCKDRDPDDYQSVPIKLRNQRFVHCEEEAAMAQAPTTEYSHRHNNSATSINRDDIELAKQSSPLVHPTVPGEDGASQSGTASASISTDMYNMVDRLVSSETSEPEQDTPEPGSSNRLSLQTATATDAFSGTPRASHAFLDGQPRAPSMEREETVRPVLPSIWNTPFAPLPGEANGSPRTRPSTARHLDPNAPVGLSSSGLFRHDLARQQSLIALQSSPYRAPEIPSSWTEHPTFNGREGAVVPAAATPFQGSGLLGLSDQGSSAVDDFGPSIHEGQKKENSAPFGIIGETPPSGQHG